MRSTASSSASPSRCSPPGRRAWRRWRPRQSSACRRGGDQRGAPAGAAPAAGDRPLQPARAPSGGGAARHPAEHRPGGRGRRRLAARAPRHPGDRARGERAARPSARRRRQPARAHRCRHRSAGQAPSLRSRPWSRRRPPTSPTRADDGVRFNAAAVVLFLIIGHALAMSQQSFGLFAGTAINDASSVVAAGFRYGSAAGQRAVVVKLTRTLFIVPLCIGLALPRGRGGEGRRLPPLVHLVPRYLVAFLGLSALISVAPPPAGLRGGLGNAALFLTTVALLAIGLSTDIRALRRRGPRPFYLGALLWANAHRSQPRPGGDHRAALSGTRRLLGTCRALAAPRRMRARRPASPGVAPSPACATSRCRGSTTPAASP